MGGLPPHQASGCTGTPSRDGLWRGLPGHVPGGKPCIRLRAAVESGGRRGSRRVAVQERGGSGSRGRPRWRWRGRPRVRVTWYKAGSHLATNTNREERPPRERQRPPSPPLAAAVPARRAPPARHRHHRARVTNAPGDREPRAPGKLCEHRSRPAPDASGGRPGAFAGRSRSHRARALLLIHLGCRRASPPSDPTLPSLSGAAPRPRLGSRRLWWGLGEAPACPTLFLGAGGRGGRGGTVAVRARPAHLAPLPEGHGVLRARAFPHPPRSVRSNGRVSGVPCKLPEMSRSGPASLLCGVCAPRPPLLAVSPLSPHPHPATCQARFWSPNRGLAGACRSKRSTTLANMVALFCPSTSSWVFTFGFLRFKRPPKCLVIDVPFPSSVVRPRETPVCV